MTNVLATWTCRCLSLLFTNSLNPAISSILCLSKRTESPHFLACSYSSNLGKNEEESLLPCSCAIWSLCSEPRVCAQWTYTVQLLYHPNSGCGDNMNELRNCFIRNFQFRDEFKLILSAEPVHSFQNATLPLTCSCMLKTVCWIRTKESDGGAWGRSWQIC